MKWITIPVLMAFASCTSQTNFEADNWKAKNDTPAREIKTDTLPALEKLIDTSYMAILPLDTMWYSPARNAAAPYTLTAAEFMAANKLFEDTVARHNKRVDKMKAIFPEHLELKNYKRQYMPYITKAGVKMLIINCFCNDSGIKNWRKQVVAVEDGGSCFFTVYINLDDGKVLGFHVNGPG